MQPHLLPLVPQERQGPHPHPSGGARHQPLGACRAGAGHTAHAEPGRAAPPGSSSWRWCSRGGGFRQAQHGRTAATIGAAGQPAGSQQCSASQRCDARCSGGSKRCDAGCSGGSQRCHAWQCGPADPCEPQPHRAGGQAAHPLVHPAAVGWQNSGTGGAISGRWWASRRCCAGRQWG